MPVETRLVQQAYKFALDPTPRQARAFASHAGAARFAYNWGVARIAEALDAYRAEKDSGVDRPTTKIPGHFDLCKAWTAWKDATEWTDRRTGEVTAGVPWVADHFVGTYQAALRDSAAAWKRFFDARKNGTRRVGRPRFKKKGRAKDSFQVHGGTLRVVDAKHIKLPKIGVVKTHESTRKLGRRLRKGDVPCLACATVAKASKEPAADKPGKCSTCKDTRAVPAARIVRGTVSRDSSGRWYIALTVELVREIRTGPSRRQRQGGTVGIDFGVRDIATLSNGEILSNPRYLESGLRRLKTAQQALSRTQSGSSRRKKARDRVGRLHARVRNLRADSIHKATTGIVHQHAVIAVEGWNVQETAQRGSAETPERVRRDRNRALADTGIGAARWQLQSKSAWYGATVVVADRHAPTGRQCSACGTVKAKPVPPAQDEYRCAVCGLSMDRRMNTARVLAGSAAGPQNDAPSGGESVNARGGDVILPAPRRGESSPVKREARARPPGRGETGTPGT